MKMMFDPCHGVHHRPVHNYIHINLYIHLGGCVTSNTSISLSSVTVLKESRASLVYMPLISILGKLRQTVSERNFWEVLEG